MKHVITLDEDEYSQYKRYRKKEDIQSSKTFFRAVWFSTIILGVLIYLLYKLVDGVVN